MKRKWTRGEKWLWAAPLIFIIGAAVAAFGPQVVRKQLCLPLRLSTTSDNRLLVMSLARDGSVLAATGLQISAGAHEGRVFFWDARSRWQTDVWGKQQPQKPIIVLPSEVNFGFALSPNGKFVAVAPKIYAANSKTYTLYNRASHIEKWSIHGQFDDLFARFSPDGQTLALAQRAKGGIRFSLLRASDGKLIASWIMERPLSYTGVFAWAPDGKSLFCGSNCEMRYVPEGGYEPPGKVEIRRARDGKLLNSWTLPLSSITNLDPAPDGKSLALIVSGTNRSSYVNSFTLMVVDALTGRIRWNHIHKGQADGSSFAIYPHLYGGIFSPDGKSVVTFPQGFGKDGKMAAPLFFDSQTGTITRQLNIGDESSFQYAPNALAFAPDGKRLYARGQNAVLVWDLD